MVTPMVRPFRVALVLALSCLALVSGATDFHSPGPVLAAPCVTTPHGMAVLYNPTSIVKGSINAGLCNVGVVFDTNGSGGTITGAVVYGGQNSGGYDGDGVVVDGVTVTLRNTELRINADDGVVALNGATLKMWSDTSHDNSQGVHIYGGATAKIYDSAFYNNSFPSGDGIGGNGIWAEDTSKVDVMRSKMYNNGDNGVTAAGSSIVNVRSGSVYGNNDDGIDVPDAANVLVQQVTVSNNDDGMFASGTSKVTLQQDGFFGNSAGLKVGGSSTVSVSSSDFSSGYKNYSGDDGVGIEIEGDCTCTADLRSSRVFNNHLEGIRVGLGGSGGSPTLFARSDVIRQNGDAGIHIFWGTAHLTSTIVNSNGVLGTADGLTMDAGSGSTANLLSSQLGSNSGNGVTVGSGDTFTATSTSIVDHKIDGIFTGGTTTLYRSYICHNMVKNIDGAYTADSRTVVC